MRHIPSFEKHKVEKMKRPVITIGLILSVFLIAGCSGDKSTREGPLAIPEADLGPETKKTVKDLPGGLIGDKQNARYTNENLRGKDEDGN